MRDFKLPNIRKIFVPDKGYMLYEADLAGADAQVVAAEAEDRDLLAAFRQGLDVHSKNAEAIWPEFSKLEGNARYARRQQCKVAVHATNYGGSARTVALSLKWSVAEATVFQRRWFALHPGIHSWHRRTEAELQSGRTATNRFGYRIIYFDRIDGLLPQALAWVPQSTVALVCFKGAIQLAKALPWCELLLQVHDSIVFQVPLHRADCVQEIKRHLAVPVPYRPDPLIIPWGLSRSEKSWGDCEKVAA